MTSMTKLTMRSALIILMLLTGEVAIAQKHSEKLRTRIDSILDKRYYKMNYDTAYIGRPNSKLTLKTRASIAGNTLHIKQTEDGQRIKADLETNHMLTFSIGANYRGLAASVSLNPAKLTGRNKDYEFNLNYYSNRFCIDASYQISETMSGNVSNDDIRLHLDRGVLRTKTLNVTGFYTFNYKRFSFPAAFSQSYIQKRSAGSWIAGFSYQGGTLKTTDKAPDEMPRLRFHVGHFAIGGGYGYNLVLHRKWLMHLSVMPTVVIGDFNNVTYNDEKKKVHAPFPEMIFNERAAVVYNMGSKQFAGMSFLMNTVAFGRGHDQTYQSKWLARAFFGIRL